jgi:hypothetical protein
LGCSLAGFRSGCKLSTTGLRPAKTRNEWCESFERKPLFYELVSSYVDKETFMLTIKIPHRL